MRSLPKTNVMQTVSWALVCLFSMGLVVAVVAGV